MGFEPTHPEGNKDLNLARQPLRHRCSKGTSRALRLRPWRPLGRARPTREATRAFQGCANPSPDLALVLTKGFEPLRPKALAPEASMSTVPSRELKWSAFWGATPRRASRPITSLRLDQFILVAQEHEQPTNRPACTCRRDVKSGLAMTGFAPQSRAQSLAPGARLSRLIATVKCSAEESNLATQRDRFYRPVRVPALRARRHDRLVVPGLAAAAIKMHR